MRFLCLMGLCLLCLITAVQPCFGQKLNWSWSNPQPHGNDIVAMAWNGTLGVQVCDHGRIYTSPDLIKWTPQKSSLTNDLQGVTFFGKRIVVVGAFGAVTYSDDGTNFTPGTLNTTNWLNSVTASASLVVAVGDNGALYTSTDGAHWGLQAPPPNLFGNWLNSVTHGNGVFVTVGDQGYIATSSNGTNWSSSSSVDAGTFGDLENVAWLNGSGSTATFPYTGFWIVTDNYTDSGDSQVLYSINNGSGWNQAAFDVAPTNVLYTVMADDSSALLAGDDEARLGSSVLKKIVWREQMGLSTNLIAPGTYLASALQTNGVYALAGYDGMLAESYLNNGTNYWNTPYFSSRDWLWQVTVADGLYVAVGDNVRIMTSNDGANWTVEEVTPANSITLTNTVFLGVGGTTNLLLAVGTGGSLATSAYDLISLVSTNNDGSLSTNSVNSIGVTWAGQPSPAGTTNDLAGIGRLNHNYFLVGGNGTLLASQDGTNWSKLSSGTTNYLSGIATATNGLLVLTGNAGTLLTSTNGTNWISRSSGTTNWLYRVRELNGRLLALGENGVLLDSTNGTNWLALNSGVTNWLNDAVMVSNTCYVVGNQGVVLASTNFINWIRADTITSKSLEGVATQNGQLVAVGFEGSILQSQIFSEPVNFLQYAQADGFNIFSVQGAVGEQFTLDSSTNLVNWVTGSTNLNIIYGDGTLIFYEDLPAKPPFNQYYRCTLIP